MKPTVGQSVHFYEDEQGPFAAVVTAVYSDICVTLAVFKPHHTSLYVGFSVMHKSAASGSRQHWARLDE